MKLEYIALKGRFLRLQPFAAELKEAVRSAVDCDPDTWAIMPVNPMGAGFDVYWSAACGAPPDQRMAYAIIRCSDDRVIGMSSYYTELVGQGGVSIGTSFLHPTVRGGPANPEAKLLMFYEKNWGSWTNHADANKPEFTSASAANIYKRLRDQILTTSEEIEKEYKEMSE